MNQAIIQQYLTAYKEKFDHIHQGEIYKWRAVQHFQNQWNPDAVDFASMLSEALSKTSNLMDSGNYFPRRMIEKAASKAPGIVREAFLQLYDERIDLQARIDTFKDKIDGVVAEHFPNKKHFQDHRAVIVYLSLRYPEEHYFYKYEVLRAFCEKAQCDYTPVKGKFSNIEAFYEICASLKEVIKSDGELLRLHFNRLGEDDYPDTEFNILTQDVMYAIHYYFADDKQVTQITRPAQAVLNVLVAHMQKGSVLPSEPQTFIGYKEVHDLLDLPMRAEAYGRSLQRQGLEALATWTKENGFPAISGLVIDRKHSMPGPGYFRAFGKKYDEDFVWWKKEIQKSMEFDWSPYVTIDTQEGTQKAVPSQQEVSKITKDDEESVSFPLPYFDTPKATDFEEPKLPERAECTSYRIIRDTKKAVWVKNLYGFKCQICGETIQLGDRNYSEAHHIKPLGKPHNGPDHESNIISVCPNHHVMLDYFAFELDMAQLIHLPVHRLNPEYIDYHNAQLDKGNSD